MSEDKKILYVIKLYQEDNEVIDIIVEEAKLVETFDVLKNNEVIWHNKQGYWINKDKVRYATFNVYNPEEAKKQDPNDIADIDISPDPED